MAVSGAHTVSGGHHVTLRHVDGEWSFEIDGQPFREVISVKYECGVGEIDRARVDFYPSDFEVEAYPVALTLCPRFFWTANRVVTELRMWARYRWCHGW